MIASEMGEALIAGTLEIDCPDITIEQNTPEHPRTFRGPGFIRCDNGRLVFRCYTGRVLDDMCSPFFPGENVAGTFFTDSELYRFTAIDSSGQTWMCPRIAPHCHTGYLHQKLIAAGELSELVYVREDEYSIGNTWNRYTLYEPLAYPWNKTSAFPSTAEERLEASMYPEPRFEFSLGEHNVTITGREKTVVSVASPLGDWQWIEKKVVECLQFAFAVPVNIAVSESGYANRETTRLRPRPRNAAKSQLKPPISFNIAQGSRELSRLMDLYFRFIESHRKDTWHPISMLSYAIAQASACSFDIEALVTSVAVEGVVNEAFRDLSVDGRISSDEIEHVRKYIRGVELTSDVKDKVLNRVGSLCDTSITEKLNQLAKEGKIRGEHVGIWREVRNHWAHGVLPLDWAFDKLSQQLDAVLVLFYTLVFAAIGYEGVFVDYSLPGCPERRYPDEICSRGNRQHKLGASK